MINYSFASKLSLGDGAVLKMIGQSAEFEQMLKRLKKIADYDAISLLQGETGTGKELAARYIHDHGSRKHRPFIAINCGAMPEQLFENELFGHRRGAYTDANNDQKGLVEMAESGTLFLDEIDALKANAQVSLLRFLQDRRYRPIGGSKERTANIRIIAASNADLNALCNQGLFRSDLLYRLHILFCEIPPLRVRMGDPALLADYFLDKFARHFNKPKISFHPETLHWFGRYAWPGNVRELENLVCREFLMHDTPHSPICITPARHPERRKLPDRRYFGHFDLSYASAKHTVLNTFEVSFIKSLLQKANGNVTVAAKLGQIERRFLGKLIKKHNIEKAEFGYQER